MRNLRYKTYLRALYVAVLDSRLSASDLKALSDELRRGQLPDELAYMIDRALDHFGSPSDDEHHDERVADAERLIRSGKVSRGALLNIMESLGLPPASNKESTRVMLTRFISNSSPSHVNKLMDILASHHGDDMFLAGISAAKR